MRTSSGDGSEPEFPRRSRVRCRGFRTGRQVERPGEEGRHLSSGYRLVGAVPPLAAAGGDAGGRQRVDGRGVAVAARVGEPGRRAVLEVEGAGQEGGHLSSGDGLVGAVPHWGGVAALGDSQLGQALCVGRPPDGGVQVGEPRVRRRGGLVDGPDEPYAHHPAQERLVGAEPTLAAFGVFQDPLAGQCFDGGFVNPRRVGVPVLRARARRQRQYPGNCRRRCP